VVFEFVFVGTIFNSSCNQGCEIGFFEAKFQKFVFFLNWLASKIHLAFGLFPGFFLNAKIICTKITHHPFSKSFYFKKNVFWSVTFRSFSATKSLCKKAPAANR